MAEISELEKVKEENKALKNKLNPLSDNEKARLKELHGLVAATVSSDPNFDKIKKEYLDLNSRVVNESVVKNATISNSRKIGG